MNVINLMKTGTQAGIYAALIINDIKTALSNQAALASEGRALIADIENMQKKQQISVIINMLNAELQSSTERLEELIARLNSA